MMMTVHLHTQGLSFEVAFVIADVVTPLLGLDAMLRESLSLHLGHDSKHFLVASGGERTQLEHKGKHLYLIACPSKLGSSNLVMSSLSNVVGFLPSDMQLDHDVIQNQALILCLEGKRLQMQGESLKVRALTQSIFGNRDNLPNKKESFTT